MLKCFREFVTDGLFSVQNEEKIIAEMLVSGGGGGVLGNVQRQKTITTKLRTLSGH